MARHDDVKKRIILAEVYREATLASVSEALKHYLENHIRLDGQKDTGRLASSVRAIAEVMEGAINDLSYDFIERLKREVQEYDNE